MPKRHAVHDGGANFRPYAKVIVCTPRRLAEASRMERHAVTGERRCLSPPRVGPDRNARVVVQAKDRLDQKVI